MRKLYRRCNHGGAANWSTAQIDAYNEAIESGDKAKIGLAVTALKSAYLGANPPAASKPKLITAVNQPNMAAGGVAPYLSQAQAQRDLANPLYKSDPAYRALVERRILASSY